MKNSYMIRVFMRIFGIQSIAETQKQKELKEIEIEKKKINKKLDIIDLKIIEQPELFPNN